MSSIALTGNAAGAGVFTLASPNSASSYTATLPTATTTLVGTDATQTLTNKTIQGGAITSGTAVASTSGTSIDFTSIPSWVKRITVMLSGVSTSGTVNVSLQIGSGSIETTGYVGSSARVTSTPAAAWDTPLTTMFQLGGYNANTDTLSGAAILNLIGSNIWTLTGSVFRSSGATPAICFFSGSKTTSGTLDRVRITTTNGTDTFDAGTINILYEG